MPSVIAWAVSSSIVLIAFVVWGLLATYARRSALESHSQRRFAVASGVYLFGWLVVAFALAIGGAFRRSPSELIPALTLPLGLAVPLLVGTFVLYRSSTLKTVLAAVPLSWLVGVQLYRTVGINFLVLHGLGLLPGEFAIPAGGGDVLVGLAAPLVGYALYKGFHWSSGAARIWNIVGILDLVVAVGTGFLTSPSPLQALAFETPNELITTFPLVLVPLFAVPLSIVLHIAALQRLKADRTSP